VLKLINTLSKQKEEFIPINKDIVTVYQCGPTMYSHQHIGNINSAVRGDLIRRSLIYLGFNVSYTRNITDVGHLVSDGDEGEDKMEKGVKREGLSPKEITEKYTKIFHDDLKKMGCINPDNETKATKYVPQIINMVQELINKGFAYATDKAIYYDVLKFPKYNDLNGQKLEMNKKGLGHGSEEDSGKKHPFDFVLWFFKTGAHKNAIQTWDHKFDGINQKQEAGFPGWHIECSVMSKSTLGDTIDIHIGGVEHIQVHHTNEIAQSESANGVKFVNYWLHHEMLEIDGGKMAKSKGNVYTLDDLINKGYDPLALRYFYLLAHYRSKQNFTFDALDAANTALDRMNKSLKALISNKVGTVNKEYKTKFIKALEDDINVTKALSIAWELLKNPEIPEEDKVATIFDFDKVFGLNLKGKTLEIKKDVKLSPEILDLLNQREKARLDKNWEEADRIRKKLSVEYKYQVVDK
jgi:cysteinyl-tRNA synthetase